MRKNLITLIRVFGPYNVAAQSRLEHGRNADPAEKTVLEAKSLSDREALENKLIDVVAHSEQHLLARVEIGAEKKTTVAFRLPIDVLSAITKAFAGANPPGHS